MSHFYTSPIGAATFLYGAALIAWAIWQPNWPSRLAGPLFALLTGLTLLFVRHDVLPITDPINPDEALMAANAMHARFGWLDWNIVDPLTSGPLNSSVLAWPRLFGGDITLFSARLTGVALYTGTLTFLYLAIRTLWGGRVALLAVLPAAIFVVGTDAPDYVHYSSEQLPDCLLAVAICLLTRGYARRTLAPLVWAALVLGAVPFAKLQAAPIAATIGFFVLAASTALARQRRSWFGPTGVVATALIPTVLLIAPLTAAGGLDDFIKSYFVEQQLRIHWHNPLPGLLNRGGTLTTMLEVYALLAIVALLSLLFSRARRAKLSQQEITTLGLAVLLVAVSLFAVAAPGRVFYHYLLLLLPAATAAGGVLLGITGPGNPRVAALNGAAAALLALVIFGAAGPEHTFGVNADTARLQGRPFASPRVLGWLGARDDDTMVCWGWASQCYLDAAMPSATREATNENQTYGTSLKGYFRDRFLADFDRSAPDFVVDAVFPGAFGFTDAKTQGVEAFPEFAQRLAKDFVLVSKVTPPSACPRLYVRAPRLARAEADLIPFAGVTATTSLPNNPASALDDWSIDDRCGDYWAVPPGQSGAATLTFSEPEPVARIMLLAARGATHELGAARVDIALVDRGDVVFDRTIDLDRFPWWTSLELDRSIEADGVRLTIAASGAIGMGIDEVKAFRN